MVSAVAGIVQLLTCCELSKRTRSATKGWCMLQAILAGTCSAAVVKCLAFEGMTAEMTCSLKEMIQETYIRDGPQRERATDSWPMCLSASRLEFKPSLHVFCSAHERQSLLFGQQTEVGLDVGKH
jgi:hypothetical protein